MEIALFLPKADLAAMQPVFCDSEAAREPSTTDKFSLELELNRLRSQLGEARGRACTF